jgi:putative PIN family toxin of toxin-antitoxin system
MRRCSVSAFLTEGPPRPLLRTARAGAFTLCVSGRLLEKVRRSLGKPKLQARYLHATEAVERFCSRLAATGCFIPTLPDMPPVCRDPDDDHVPAAGIATSAAHIVTGDGDLLDPHEHQGICLLTARQFLEGLAA